MKSETFIVRANKDKDTRQVITCSIEDILVKELPISVVFFYRKSFHYDALMNSLKEVLSDFPVFAGRLKNVNNNLCIHCNNKGVLFSVRKEDCTLDHFLDKLPTIQTKRLVDTIDPKKAISNQNALMTIKLTSFICGGMALGVCWHHSIGDMHTFMYFMKAWSNTVNKKEYILPLIVREREEYIPIEIKPEKIDKTISSVRYLDTIEYFRLMFYLLFQAWNKVPLVFYFSENELKNMKQNFSEITNQKLSKNDVLCAHLFSIISDLDKYKKERYLTIPVNYRSRTNLPSNILGNFVSCINILNSQRVAPFQLAKDLRTSVDNFKHHMNLFSTREYIEHNGGIRKINRFFDTYFEKNIDPLKRALLISNWANFGVYDVIFGESNPIFFTFFGSYLIPWLSSIYEGFSNNGLIYSAVLPSKLAKKLMQDDNLGKIHKYRARKEAMPELVGKLGWLL